MVCAAPLWYKIKQYDDGHPHYVQINVNVSAVLMSPDMFYKNTETIIL